MDNFIPDMPYLPAFFYVMKEVLKMIISKSKTKVEIKVDPARLRPTDEPVIWGSNAKIFKDTSWKPKISLEDTISWVLDYWRQKV